MRHKINLILSYLILVSSQIRKSLVRSHTFYWTITENFCNYSLRVSKVVKTYLIYDLQCTPWFKRRKISTCLPVQRIYKMQLLRGRLIAPCVIHLHGGQAFIKVFPTNTYMRKIDCKHIHDLGTPLLTWINFNPSLQTSSHVKLSVRWHCLSIPKL